MRGLFVTGTGTGVGKTVLSAALLAAMAASGEPVRAHKPVVTGLDEPPGEWPPDHELLAAATGQASEEVAPLRYGPAVSPHLAAELAGRRLDPAQLLDAARAAGQEPPLPASPHAATQGPQLRDAARGAGHAARAAGQGHTLVVEGVGGLLVPLADDYTVRDLAVELGLALVIAAAPGLGTINHTLLTLEAARAAGLDVCAVVLTPWAARPSAMEQSNRDTIAQLGAVEVAGLPHLPGADLAALADAGAQLPWRRWLTRERCSR